MLCETIISCWREMRACNDNTCGESQSQNFHDRLLDLTCLIAATAPKAPMYRYLISRQRLFTSSYRQWWHAERAKTRSAPRSLRGNVGGDQRVRRPLQQHRRLAGLVQRCADKCAVDQHRELTCEGIGIGAMQPFRDD